MSDNRYKWAAPGDVNAFFGLMLDNIAGLIMAVTLLASAFQFPVDFAIRYMVPGTALGVLAGDLMYFVLAFLLARKTGRNDVTAMPLGLDTPSTIGMVFFVLGPAYASRLPDPGSGAALTGEVQFAAAMHAWHVGIWAIILTGLIKLVLSFGSGWAQRTFPRAGLLGSLAAIALALIAFNQLPKLLGNPVAGFASLLVVLVTLVGRNRLPWGIPGAAAAVGVGCLLWHLMRGADAVFQTGLVVPGEPPPEVVWFPREWLTVFEFGWLGAFQPTLAYLPYIIPFAITTVIGGIDCAESAASAGDVYPTRNIIGVEAIATILAGACGGVIQTTPYIGHPAYKAMGGRAAYTLATALFVGGAGVVGYFGLMFAWIPEAAVLPILLFIGLEITAQSFHATPRRHYAALAIACLPALAKLVMITAGQLAGSLARALPDGTIPEPMATGLLHLGVLAAGFIITSLLWASALADIIDRRFSRAAVYLAVAALLTAFGVIHSPLPGDRMFVPWPLSFAFQTGYSLTDPAHVRVVVELVVCYLLMSAMLVGFGRWTGHLNPPLSSDREFEELG